MKKIIKEDIEFIYAVAENLIGSCQNKESRRDIIVSNVSSRAEYLEFDSILEYINFALSDEKELEYLISALTIHTTSWFREAPHFQFLREETFQKIQFGKYEMEIWCAASSTGEEVYSTACIFEEFRKKKPGLFEYKIIGTDIDPCSISVASKAVYSKESLSQIPSEFKKMFLLGSGKAQGFFTLNKEIRSRCQFQTANLINPASFPKKKFDLILCRNVLIYFSKEKTDFIIQNLSKKLKKNGAILLGHSESIAARSSELVSLGGAIFKKKETKEDVSTPQIEGEKTDVLIVDDSATVRGLLSNILEKAKLSVAVASSGKDALEILKKIKPRIITLDLQMPEMDGITFLRRFRATGNQTPVIVVSGTSSDEANVVFSALESGAQDYLEKSMIEKDRASLLERIITYMQSTPTKVGIEKIVKKETIRSPEISLFYPDYIVIGASTGGTDALIKLLANMPSHCPPILVVQHIIPNFAKPFAERLSRVSGLSLMDTKNEIELKPGGLYMAWEDYHIGVRKNSKLSLYCYPSKNNPIYNCRPSVDFLFQSTAMIRGKCIAVLLTGMGKDGAIGLSELKKTGALTLAQNQQSCVVYGMPKEAVKLGAVAFSGDLREIRNVLNQAMAKNKEEYIEQKVAA